MTTSHPLVSVVVITYQSSAFVLETLESVRQQTYHNIELIISDDGSTDETVALCTNWLHMNQSRFVNTAIITVEKNTGIPANCNRGCKEAKGEWIKLIAGDDVLLHDAIENNVHQFNVQNDIQVLFSNMEVYKNNFDKCNLINTVPSVEQKKMILHSNSCKAQFNSFVSNAGHWGLAPTMFIKKEAIVAADFFDERYPFIEDFPFQIRLVKRGICLHWFDLCTVKYRKHTSNISATKSSNLSKNRLVSNHKMLIEYVFPNVTLINRLNLSFMYYIDLISDLLRTDKGSLWGSRFYKLMQKFNIFRYITKIANKTIFEDIRISYRLKSISENCPPNFLKIKY